MRYHACNRFSIGLVLILLLAGCAQPTPPNPAKIAPTPTATPSPTATKATDVWPPIRGLAYSPYRDCQSPDSQDQPTEANVEQDLQIISGMANAIRTYSSTGINGKVPALARQAGLRVSAGAWLNKDKAANAKEIQGLIDIAKNVELESVIVGNEVLLRGDLSEDELLGYIQEVKAAVKVPVTTAEIGGVLLAHPRVMAAVDYEMVHLYPFWSGASIDGAAQTVINEYHDIQAKSNGKRVVIGETGWPSGGPMVNAALPSPENQQRFAQEFLNLALQDKVDFFYFDAFDEMWKTEGGVGAFWGLLHSDRTFKSDLQSVMISSGATPQPASPGSGLSVSPTAGPTGTPASSIPGDFYVYSTFADPNNHFAPGGWMGDLSAIGVNTCWLEGQTWPKTVIQLKYTPIGEDPKDWAGAYWLQPDGNWGTVANAGFDLSAYKQLVFKARAEVPGTQIKFLVGGVSMDNQPTPSPLPFPSSIKTPVFAREADPVDGFVNLADSWQEYHIDLSGLDLHDVIDGFGVAAEQARTPDGAVFYLDDIRFVTAAAGPAPLPTLHIYSGQSLRSGLDMGVDSAGHAHDWVEDLKGQMKASYPAEQGWGTIYITVGKPAVPGWRASMDMSKYSHLSIEMRADADNQLVYIGMKDRFQPDNGSETLLSAQLTTQWETYTFDLQDFLWADLAHIYIPIEFVFRGGAPATIYFRNIQICP